MAKFTGVDPIIYNDIGSMVLHMIASEISKINTSFLAKVVKVDGNKVDVAPLLKRENNLGEVVDGMIVQGICVYTASMAGFEIVPPVAVDDIGLCIALQEDIQSYMADGNVGLPLSPRRFDRQDSIFLPCKLQGAEPFEADTVTLANKETKVSITMKDDALSIKAKGDVALETEAKLFLKVKGDVALEADGDINVKGSKVTLNGDCELGGAGGADVLTKNAIIIGNQGAPCSIQFAGSTKTKAL